MDFLYLVSSFMIYSLILLEHILQQLPQMGLYVFKCLVFLGGPFIFKREAQKLNWLTGLGDG